MNMIKVFEPVDDHHAMSMPLDSHAETRGTGGGSGGMGGREFALRRSGGRPVCFSGRLLGEHSGQRAGVAFWHELALYRTDDGRYVSDIRVLCKSPGASDHYHVRVHDGLEEALRAFEGHDARLDVVADFDLDDAGLVPAELMVRAAALRYRIADAQAQYRTLVGAFLAELNQR